LVYTKYMGGAHVNSCIKSSRDETSVATTIKYYANDAASLCQILQFFANFCKFSQLSNFILLYHLFYFNLFYMRGRL